MNADKNNGKEGFAHYMLKEIYDQPEAVRTVIEANLSREGRMVGWGSLPN